MNVDFFVQQIAMNKKSMESYLRNKVMKNEYVAYEEKIAKCETIIKNTSVIKDEATGIEIYKRNTPACNLFFNLTLIDLYTNIEIDFSKNMLKDYNELERHGYIDLLLSYIPKPEYVAWQKLIDMIASDYMENNRSLVSYLDTKLTAIDRTADSFSKVLTSLVDENK